jgi:hypothetical protein
MLPDPFVLHLLVALSDSRSLRQSRVPLFGIVLPQISRPPVQHPVVPPTATTTRILL